ncbi:related to EMI5 - protein required for transcriptional induction of the early meiotic-specific transcription factor IME1 [Fusarium torulosum]|uniref:Succinate dehydrogenase assembly factor 2, mitochondrial n=1 Tax=Fusarium torulosum TaxID=33205 RepID=A0AAE8MFG7_9HYPO|nr:related to EMI5 - protein required for transcriptional induction of the early meiotic-specific transcription factor IME1 [Fusarium torulosum]
MASLISRTLRPAAARRFLAMPARPLSTTALLRSDNASSEFAVGELHGAKFRVEPLRRVGEDDNTKRARLVYQSRKRGTLESDLLLSTFAAAHLSTLSPELLDQYDRFLDENDWDIYYWATQKEELSSTNPSSSESPSTTDIDAKPESDQITRQPPTGEWAQTVGNFKPAYRPVPARWRNSEILDKLRAHVRSRSVDGGEGGGMGFMPPLEPTDIKN